MSEAPSAGTGSDEPVRRRARPGAVAILAGTGLAALLLDLLTKHLALVHLTDREPLRLLGGLIYLNLIRNSGAAWSIGSDHTWVFPLITIAVIGWIVWMALRLRSVPWAISLGLVLGGALGNLMDRIFRAPGHFVGHVVDMISVFGPFGEYFPVFNLADSSLVCGVILAVLLELTGRQRDGGRVGRDGRPAADPATVTEQRERA
ncbi:signal peptidase II [Micromonospora musae]|uniref:Lipoprotein signal peptidase n=1 Tax=Micromonospora musae TaxID=1894970 RepID=A0A3A9YBH7_9ACTN|nr:MULTISPECIES: signal peptidase II [Micromonospora]RKN18809.1 signal peptidase II [Micromonospora musae]RKN34621.1 signal peptidase II [Micromonospora musae]TYC03698.1 signal peptidase II [Micromonospora sp. WP24]